MTCHRRYFVLLLSIDLAPYLPLAIHYLTSFLALLNTQTQNIKHFIQIKESKDSDNIAT